VWLSHSFLRIRSRGESWTRDLPIARKTLNVFCFRRSWRGQVASPVLPIRMRFNVRIDAGRSRLTLLRPDGWPTAHRRRFDAVVVWKLDRFARSASHLLALETFRTQGIEFVSFSGNSTPAPRPARWSLQPGIRLEADRRGNGGWSRHSVSRVALVPKRGQRSLESGPLPPYQSLETGVSCISGVPL